MKIQRTMFWFNDGDDQLLPLTNRFYEIGHLLNRLINEKYTSKRIRLINICFYSQKSYDLYPLIPRGGRLSSGVLNFHALLDFANFNCISDDVQTRFIWDRTYEFLQISAKEMKNEDLLNSIEYGYHRGIELNLNPDYRMVEAEVVLYGSNVHVSVWANFRREAIHAVFTIEKNGQIIFTKEIDKGGVGVEYFLEIFKSIGVVGNSVIIKGSKDEDYLPLKIFISEELIVNVV